jgi:hypothetical protein
MLPLTDLSRWYKEKVPTEPCLSTGQTIICDHCSVTLGQTGHCIKTQSMNTINTSNRTNQLSQLWEKQIEPHKNLQKPFFKTPNIIPINDKHFLLGQQETAICCCNYYYYYYYYYYYIVFVMKTMYNRFKGTHICAPLVKIKENTNKCTIPHSCYNYSIITLTHFLTLWFINICITCRL